MRKLLEKILSRMERTVIKAQMENLRIKHYTPWGTRDYKIEKIIEEMVEHRERTGIR